MEAGDVAAKVIVPWSIIPKRSPVSVDTVRDTPLKLRGLYTFCM